jgi:hypothetical protein
VARTPVRCLLGSRYTTHRSHWLLGPAPVLCSLLWISGSLMNKSGFRLLNLASFAPDLFKSQFSISLSKAFSEIQAIRTMPSTLSCFLIMAHRKATAPMTLCFTTLTYSLSLYSMATALVFANSCSITNTRVINRSFKLLPSLVSLMVSRQVIMTPEYWRRPRSTPQPQVDSGPISTVRSMGSFKCPRRMWTTL